MLLSFERYRAIVHPFKEKFNKRKLSLVYLVIGLFIITFWVILLLLVTFIESLPFITSIWFSFGHLVIDILAPLTSMCYFYNRISKVIQSETIVGGTGMNESTRRKKKALRTLKYLITIYALCVAPGRSMLIVQELLGYKDNKLIINHTFEASNLLLFANNIANIFIYIVMMSNLRTFLFIILTCGYKKKRTSNSE